MSPSLSSRLAVCSWSLQPETPRELAEKLATANIRRTQLALDPLKDSPEAWRDSAAILASENIAIVSGMLRCLGEDYSTLETIRITGGIAPDETWEPNLRNFRACAEHAVRLGLKLVTLHAGFIPHKTGSDSAGFEKILNRVRAVADIFAPHKIALGLETGQETAGELSEFLSALAHPSVGVNFDPANMLLYDKGDPVAAVRALAPWLMQVHIKDATRTKTPGAWGDEVPVGAGEVDWRAFFAALHDVNYTGDLAIEREAGTQRLADIITARDIVSKLLA